MENPLGGMPVSTSQQFTLDSIDWRKILRYLLVQIIGAFVAYAPSLMGYRYAIGGIDLTPMVLMLVPVAVEAGRRFLAGAPRQ